MINLKHVLMELGNKLVLDHGYDPAAMHRENIPNTMPIKILTDFLNESPEARVELRRMGIEWSVVPKGVS